MMTTITIILAAAILFGLAVAMTAILGWANRAFHVAVDPRIDQINEALPGANCGACGYVGCGEYAEALMDPEVEVNRCPVGGEGCASAIAAILGRETGKSWPVRPVIHCAARYPQRLQRRTYDGETTCRSANIIGGVQGCTYGCLGFGDCQRICPFDAIHVINGLAVVDYEACVGCGKCAKICPRHIISMTPFKTERIMAVTCSNQDFGKAVTEVCLVGCIGCKMCVKTNEWLDMDGNLPTVDYNAYIASATQDDTAIGKCPREALVWVGKPGSADLAATADSDTPDIVAPDFKTTIDQTEWRG